MQDRKENQFGNFAKLLRKLEIDNLAIPELRQLKQEHAYLQKLRLQRTKIEELKAKHDAAEIQLRKCYKQLAQHKQLIEEQHKTIQVLSQRVEQSEQKRNLLENNLLRAIEIQKDKQKHKMNEFVAQIEKLKEETKAKNYALFEMEDEIEHKTKQFKDQLQQDRKKMLNDCELKINQVLQEKKLLEQQNEQLKELVTRQHKALQLQNQQYEESNRRNQELSDNVASLEQRLEESVKLRAQAEDQVAQVAGLMERMQEQISELKIGKNAKDQVEQLRKKVSELAKGQIERIQFIVNEFD